MLGRWVREQLTEGLQIALGLSGAGRKSLRKARAPKNLRTKYEIKFESKKNFDMAKKQTV